MKIIVGLGNPGNKYKNTRHNLGFEIIDSLAKEEHISFKINKLKAATGKGMIGAEEIILVKPLTYMNNSGMAVREVVNKIRAPLDNLLVVCDDFQLPLGKIRIRQKGSSGGHNGLDSIIQHLGSSDFPRLRVGIGEPANHDAVEHVLENFSRAERKEINQAIERAVSAIREWMANGIESSMNKFN